MKRSLATAFSTITHAPLPAALIPENVAYVMIRCHDWWSRCLHPSRGGCHVHDRTIVCWEIIGHNL